MAKQKPFIIEHDGYRCEWFTRRSQLEVNVYRGDKLICELVYPKIPGIGFSDFTGEAIAIAKREIETSNKAITP
ncbi:MAG: hypothetical protein M3R24_33775 [Chloroflexota bacterium]|nr:hypothetical protein [Chloroflexota bacterium]